MNPQPAPTGGVVLRHLKSAREIERVLHLRNAIDISVHAMSGRSFADLEKKETSMGSSVLSR